MPELTDEKILQIIADYFIASEHCSPEKAKTKAKAEILNGFYLVRFIRFVVEDTLAEHAEALRIAENTKVFWRERADGAE